MSKYSDTLYLEGLDPSFVGIDRGIPMPLVVAGLYQKAAA